jgi:thiamine pyrophosphate-dependent acetolactate synthase large subunit-like protein
LQHFAELTNVPVFNSSKFNTDFPFDHPLRAGMATKLAALRYIGQQQPDLIILLGVRTGFLLAGRSGAILPNQGCKYIQVDVDGSEIGRSQAIDIGIVSDVSEALKALNAELSKGDIRKAPDEWVKMATSLKHLPSPHEAEPQETSPGRPHPYHAIKKVLSSLEPEAIIIIDGGEAGAWVQDLIEQARASLYLVSTGYLGFLGNGWGYSLGAAIAEPSKQIVNMQGDGSALFHVGKSTSIKLM